MPSRSGTIGVAGEHYAAAELSRRGFLVTLTRGNAPGVDILSYSPESKRTWTIQVKTIDGRKREAGRWILGPKDEDEDAVRSDFFIFIHLPKDLAPPEYTIVPSKEVARSVRAEFEQWATKPGAKGQARDRANKIRTFRDKEGKWRERWEMLS